MTLNKIKAATTIATNLRADGQTSRAEYVEELAAQCLKFRTQLELVIQLLESQEENRVERAILLAKNGLTDAEETDATTLRTNPAIRRGN